MFILSSRTFILLLLFAMVGSEEQLIKTQTQDWNHQDNKSEMFKQLNLPWIIYGTAWKKERTKQHVINAFRHGFRAFDTANMPKHYYEKGVGEAFKELGLFASETSQRKAIFIQTKFTPNACEGEPVEVHPYTKHASIATRVRESFKSSLHHLGLLEAALEDQYFDSYVLHAPFSNMSDTLEAWRAMEELYNENKVRHLGVSNFNIYELYELHKHASVPIKFVQNRCRYENGWDVSVRRFCEENEIIYQGFWLLTGNKKLMETDEFKGVAEKYQRTKEQIQYRYAHQALKMILLDGTTTEQHMVDDLAVEQFNLLDEDIKTISSIEVAKEMKQDVRVYFVNEAKGMVDLYWKSHQNEEVYQGSLAQGAFISLKSFDGHVFIARQKQSLDKQPGMVMNQWTVSRREAGDCALFLIEALSNEGGRQAHGEL